MQVTLHTPYYGIDELEKEWDVSSSRVKNWLISGALQSHILLPIMSVYSLKETFNGAAQLEHFEGFVPLSQYHCQRLFRSGQVTLREFSSQCGNQRYRLPDSSEDIFAHTSDLLVLADQREQFEKKKDEQLEATISPMDKSATPLSPADFECIYFAGETHHFGFVQAQVLYTLYQDFHHSSNWTNGKRLLAAAGSKSFTLSNVFKRKPIWKQIIQSNGRGDYRLHPDFIATL